MKKLVGLLAVLLAACGGGGSGGEPEAVQAASACRVSVLLNGDSTHWGYEPGGGGARATVTPESALQREMDARFGAGVVTVRTGAVSGTTSTDALTQPRDADVVLYNPGINDYGERMPEETYRANLRTLSAVPGAVFVTPLPVKVEPAHFAGVMREVAAETGTPLIDSRAYAESVPGWWQLAPDGVHPNSEGYRVIVHDVIAPALAVTVRSLCS